MDKIAENVILTSNIYREEREYWKEKMNGNFMLSSLPVDHTTDANGVQEIQTALNESVVKRMYDMCNGEPLGLYVLLLTGVNYIIKNYSGYNDIVVGMPSKKEDNNYSASSVLYPVRTVFEDSWTVKDLILNNNNSVEKALVNSNLSFNTIMKLIEKDVNEDQRIQTVVILESLHGSTCEYDPDLLFTFNNHDDSIDISIKYNASYFLKETVDKIAQYLNRFYEGAFENTSKSIKDIYIYSKNEIEQVIINFNDTDRAFDSKKLAHQMFEDQVKRTPDILALSLKDQVLTYDDLNKKANQLARLLNQKGVVAGCTIAIMMDRSFDLFIAMLGVLKAGGAFLLIDPEYPSERIKYMTDNSESYLLLTKNKFLFYVSVDCERIPLDDLELSNIADEDLDNAVKPEHPAYIVYTSGSTGLPKGATIKHESFVNLMYAMEEKIDYHCGSSILALTTITFDIFLLESFYPLTKGLRVVIANEDEISNLQNTSDLITKEKIDILQLTPSRLKMLLKHINQEQTLRNVKILMIGGEAFTQDLYDQLITKTNARIFNMYGPIETTIWITIKEIKDRNEINIGRPIANTYIYILDTNNAPVPVGIPGELCVAGKGLSTGYINNPTLTKEKFIQNPIPSNYVEQGVNDRIYFTGDMAKWLPNGDIQFIGRADYQIKLRGYRIELGEIEKVLQRHENIYDTAVVVKDGKDGEQHLYAYIVANKILSSKELKEFMSNYLPHYMVPAFFVFMDKLPVTLNGKVDRKSLIALKDKIEREAFYVEPRNELERTLVEIWERVIKVENIGIDDEFELLGGDSLMAMKLELEMEMNDLEITNIDILQNRTIRYLVEFFERKEDNSKVSSI